MSSLVNNYILNMEFIKLESVIPLERDIEVIESRFQLKFPISLRQHFLSYNGGRPIPDHFTDDDFPIRTIVNKTLPIISNRQVITAESTYRLLVIEKLLVPKSLFPFAIDVGGDYFFIDCTERREDVYFYDSTRLRTKPLCNLHLNLTQFFESLHNPE